MEHLARIPMQVCVTFWQPTSLALLDALVDLRQLRTTKPTRGEHCIKLLHGEDTSPGS